MVTIDKKTMDQSEQKRQIGRMKIEIVTVNGRDYKRNTAEPGWRWSEDMKPVAKTESCQVNHTLYLLSGKLHVRTDDGKEMEFNPGDMGQIAPGHDGWTVGNQPAVWLEF